jgi:radical SAM protein with 4Fe4S-binding SPASM domain
MHFGTKKKFPLRSVVVELTSACNLDCLYCYNVHKMQGGPLPVAGGYKASLKVLKKLFDVADISSVTMSGGEPLLSERFLEVVLYCRMKHMAVSVITNGTKGSADDYRHLVSMGVSLFELPIHSEDAAVHDAMVKMPGAQRKVLQSVETLLLLGATVVPVIVITKLNADSIGRTIEFVHSLGLRRIMLNRFNLGGSGIAHEKMLRLSIDELRHVFAEADRTVRKLKLAATSNVCTPKCALNPDDYRSIRFAYCDTDATVRPLTLNPSGDLRICNHSPIVMGNIFNEPLAEMLTGNYARSWATSRPVVCAACTDWSQCLGGCRAASEQLGLGLSEVDPLLTFRKN